MEEIYKQSITKLYHKDGKARGGKPFIKKSKEKIPPVIPEAHVIQKCYVLIDKKIRRQKDPYLKARLMSIQVDVGSIIRML